MTAAKRRLIKQLRALADSTTFPEEAKSARAKADKLEASLPAREVYQMDSGPFDLGDISGVDLAFNQAWSSMDMLNTEMLRAMLRQAMDDMMKDGL